MLNRRILRVKAMQGLYAYYNSMDANYNLCIDRIKEEYNTMLLNDHSLDKKENEKKKRMTLRLFQEAVEKQKIKKLTDQSSDPEKMAIEYYNSYKNSSKNDFSYFRKNIVSGAENIFNLYLLLLLLPGEMADHEETETSLKQKSLTPGKTNHNESSGILNSNKIIIRLKQDTVLKDHSVKNKISWKKHSDIISDLFNNQVKKDKEYLKFREAVNRDPEEDRKFCIYLFRDLLFKNEAFNDFMESVDISWFEDSDVLKSMVLKTIKSLEINKQQIEFSSLSKNWPDDREFFCKIFETTVKNGKEYDEIIAQKSRNWDISRIASTDRIILKMAIGEMINFPGIPVKVTINEYIELSKNFSTPKSKKFVNGILDVVSNELLEKGIIKKSGRGLIDNQ